MNWTCIPFMKLAVIIVSISFFLISCSPIIQGHGFQVADIVNKEPQEIGKSTKGDVLLSYGTPSVKIEDIDNTWLYISNTKQKNVFSKDDLGEQVIFAFKFDENDVLTSQTFYDKDGSIDILIDKSYTHDDSGKYTLLDQIYDAFTRGL